jgi:hypothetical protein
VEQGNGIYFPIAAKLPEFEIFFTAKPKKSNKFLLQSPFLTSSFDFAVRFSVIFYREDFTVYLYSCFGIFQIKKPKINNPALKGRGMLFS